ncbi:MAG TPA: HAD hydrolase-like protein, partial [Polyangiaceae bacterium]|nr:HAD hydrolase-like protein [Polyangiaceae bacterium]
MTRGALLFDLDGTLTDPREGITRCLQHALETIGAAVPGERELQRWIGQPLQQSLRSHLGANNEALVDKGIAAYRERFAAIGMFENVVYAEIPAALAELKASGWAMFVATSKPSLFARQTVEHFGL